VPEEEEVFSKKQIAVPQRRWGCTFHPSKHPPACSCTLNVCSFLNPASWCVAGKTEAPLSS